MYLFYWSITSIFFRTAQLCNWFKVIELNKFGRKHFFWKYMFIPHHNGIFIALIYIHTKNKVRMQKISYKIEKMYK